MVQDVSCGSYPFSLSNVVPGVVDAAKDARAAEILFLMMDAQCNASDGAKAVAQSVFNRPLQRSSMVQDVDDGWSKMAQELLDRRRKMLEEAPERLHEVKALVGRSLRAQRGKRNFDTWKEASRSEVPSTTCMRQLLNEVGADSTGSTDSVRRRFKRTFSRDSVSLSDRQWRILTVPKVYRGRKANIETWRNSKAPSLTWMRTLLQQEEENSVGCDQDIRKRFKYTFGKNDVVFSNGTWSVQSKFFPREDHAAQSVEEYCPNSVTFSGIVPPPSELVPPPSELVLSTVRVTKSVDRAVDLVYQHLYSSVNRNLDHNGASTYAEITRGGVSQIIDAISKCFVPHLTQKEASAFRAIDLGGGYLTCLSHIAQVIPGEYVGIEYCPRRSAQFAYSYGALLDHHAEALCNTKIAFSNTNILDLHSYDCDLVYTFDEAFPYVVWKKIVKTFVASRRCKFLIMFKVAKAYHGYKALLNELLQAGLRPVHKLQLNKKGGETSTAMFFIKDRPSNNGGERVLRSQHCLREESNWFWGKCKEFWGCTEMAKKAVAELIANTGQQISNEKNDRKR